MKEADIVRGYSPLDETLRQPRYQILRAMRHYDWVATADLLLGIGVPDYDGYKTQEWQRYLQILSMLSQEKLIEFHPKMRCWRITRAGMKEAARPIREYNAYIERVGCEE